MSTPVPPAPPAPPAPETVAAPGGTAAATIELPALHVQALSGTDAGTPGTPVANATVTVTDQSCTSGGNPVKRTFATDSSGNLPDPGLPAGVYDVCVDDGTKTVTSTGVDLKSFADVADFQDGTPLDVYLGAGTNGTCP
jgi:hypothetical protein